MKCGGREGVVTALKEGRVLKQEVGGMELFFFPQITFSKADGLKLALEGRGRKPSRMMTGRRVWDTGLGFNQGIMDDSDVGLGGGTSSFQQVALPPPAAHNLCFLCLLLPSQRTWKRRFGMCMLVSAGKTMLLCLGGEEQD